MYKYQVCIVLTTYNSQQFIAEQLASLLSQTRSPDKLLISDDGSTDGTLEICKRFAADKSWVEVFERGSLGTSGVTSNFEFLSRKALLGGAEYVFFCDHDDIWHSDKIEKFLHAFETLSVDDGEGKLVHCDLAVINQEGLLENESFDGLCRYKGIVETPLSELLHRNVVTGCSMAVDSRLLAKAIPFTKSGILHDHWLALHAKTIGASSYIKEALVYYRIHGNNLVGKKPTIWRYARWEFFSSGAENFFFAIQAAEELYLKFLCKKIVLDDCQVSVIKNFFELKRESFFKRITGSMFYFKCYSGSMTFWLGIFLMISIPALESIFRQKR